MNRDLPKLFDEFVDARKNGFLAAKEFKENGGKLAGCLCSLYAPGAAGRWKYCGHRPLRDQHETIPDAEKVLPKTCAR